MYNNLKKFIELLESRGELIRITAPVDPILEVAEITDRISKSSGGGKALLFENTSTPFPILTNMMGSRQRTALALGVENLDEISMRIESLIRQITSPQDSIYDRLKILPLLGEMSQWMPKISKKKAECQQVVLQGKDVRLSMLPILKCWPHDGGRFITLPMVCTIDPDTGIRNVGMYRMQTLTENTTAMHWHLHKTGERHYRAYKKRGERMPVSVALGGDPVYTYAATAPMPDNMDEWMLAGFLRRKPVRLVRSLTNNIFIPSDCDIVIEGWVDPNEEKVTEGPFGDHTGFYSLEDNYPVFHVEAITHRRDAIYPATIVGIPPQEDAYIAQATEKIFLAPIRLALQPEVRDLYMPQSGVAHNIAIVDIESSYSGQPFKVAGALWGAGQMMFNKMMMLTNTDDDIRSPHTLARLLRSVDIPHSVTLSKGVLDVLDHATATTGTGGKIALDATVVGDPPLLTLPDVFELCGGVEYTNKTFADEWGALFLGAAPDTKIDIAKFMKTNGIEGVNFVIVFDTGASLLPPEQIVWLVAANCNPGRDMTLHEHSLIVDGRSKLPETSKLHPSRWPNVVTSSAETIATVDKRWSEYGFEKHINSPSLNYFPLLFEGGAKS